MRRDGDEITDHELVARVRAGDDRAFELLYTRYHRRIAAYVQGMVHDHARAEDVTQDVFMSALRRMRETDRPIAFKPWIYEIAKNACIDQFRRSKRAEEVSYDAEDGLASADYGKLVTKDPAPERAFENKQQLDHLRGAFGGLSETHHQILVMRELEGLSYREIGERLGMTRPAVESTLFRARRRLTEEYEDLVTGERCQRVQGIIAMAASEAGLLGARDRKRLARHVSYCQPCLRHARLSGLDARDLTHTPVRTKIAALLPLPAFLKRKLFGVEAASGPGAPAPDVSSMAVWSAHASQVDPGVVTGWGKAAMGAATIALAGVGAGVATSPPDSARAGADHGSLIERVRGGSDDGGGTSAAAVQAAPITLPAAAGSGSGAGSSSSSGKSGSGGKRTVATRSSGTKAVAGGGGSASSTSGGGSGTRGPGTLAPGGAPAADGSSSSPKSSSSDSGTSSSGSGTKEQTVAKKDPVTEAVSGVTGAVSGATGTSGSGTTSGGGTTGGTTQTPTQTQPTIRLPELPSPPPPSGGTTGSGPVGEVVEGAAGAVGGVLDGVNRTVEGVTNGLGGILGGQ